MAAYLYTYVQSYWPVQFFNRLNVHVDEQGTVQRVKFG